MFLKKLTFFGLFYEWLKGVRVGLAFSNQLAQGSYAEFFFVTRNISQVLWGDDQTSIFILVAHLLQLETKTNSGHLFNTLYSYNFTSIFTSPTLVGWTWEEEERGGKPCSRYGQPLIYIIKSVGFFF